MGREPGREKREDLGVINQSTCPDSRQNRPDIKVLSCQSCFTAYSMDKREKLREKGGGLKECEIDHEH